MIKTGILGGSFNPIHNGHIALAQAVLSQCRLDEVWLMVSPQNPLKQQAGLLNDELRYQMACHALQGIEGLRASDYEFQLPRPSYTWTTLQHLSRDFPDRRFVLLIGGDNWAHFEQWYHWQDILRTYDVVVYPRDGHTGTVSLPLYDVSSTEVRRRVSTGQDISGLVPPAITEMVVQYYR